MSRKAGADTAGATRARGSRANSTKGRAERPAPGTPARKLAIEAMVRIERGGAFANIVLPNMLADAGLADEDRRFVTNLVYGTTRMKRACDHLVDRFLLTDVDDEVRAGLRIGAYQLAWLGTPPHAAVAATVGAVSGRKRSVVNAVLRKVAQAEVEYPDDATRLSYPDWIHDRLVETLGRDDALAAMEAMNQPAETVVRDDGYIQDEASQHVVRAVEAEPDQLVVDLCAAPGGKATGLAAAGARVVAADRRLSRVRLITANLDRFGTGPGSVTTVVGDGRYPPLPAGVADRVLIDAPCSGFGSFRRRPDSRWRIDPEGPERLADLQVELIRAGLGLLKPGGRLTYSVCTYGATEGRDVIDRVMASEPDAVRLPEPAAPWVERNGMAVLLAGATDGMMLARLARVG